MSNILTRTNPIDYFNKWLKEDIMLTESYSVLAVMDALNRHPMAQDETAQDYLMPNYRYRESVGQFRILGENQDGWYCFVYAGDEQQPNPPVYFESSLDLVIDHGFSNDRIIKASKAIKEDHILLCQEFTQFLWHMLGQQMCIRDGGTEFYYDEVNGVNFAQDVQLDESFINPLGCEFPSAYTCHISDLTICDPCWGATFINKEARLEFIEKYQPSISYSWQ